MWKFTMPEINPLTGNYHTAQEIDVYWSVLDRMFTPRGTRLGLPRYGFPYYSWPQLTEANLRQAVLAAVRSDSLVDRVGFERDTVNGELTVNIETDQRVGGW